MLINLAMVMRDKGLKDAEMASSLDMRETDFIDKKCGLSQFSTCEKLAVSLVLGYPVTWLFERV